jgi:2-polyprenyl-3-methyl-5-hydroxy-6-metoxy-1,4-benzoquinol methylase
MTPKHASDFYDLMVSRKMYSGKSNLKFYLKNLFENVDFTEKEVLDVGGGRGLLSFYAAVEGARRAICLEPEVDGSRNGMINAYNEIRSEFPESLPVNLIPLTLQDYLKQTGPESFDVIIMHNSINHLDEEACIHLLDNEDCYNRYVAVFKNVHRIMKKNGTLIITDAARNNFFNDIGIKNIFTPTIEWHKHQQPKTWVNLLKEAGFKNASIHWLTPNRLGNTGKLLMDNYFISYLTRSYFKMTMKK